MTDWSIFNQIKCKCKECDEIIDYDVIPCTIHMIEKHNRQYKKWDSRVVRRFVEIKEK